MLHDRSATLVYTDKRVAELHVYLSDFLNQRQQRANGHANSPLICDHVSYLLMHYNTCHHQRTLPVLSEVAFFASVCPPVCLSHTPVVQIRDLSVSLKFDTTDPLIPMAKKWQKRPRGQNITETNQYRAFKRKS